MKRGIDISRFQEADFNLKDLEIDFAILRIGGRDGGDLTDLFLDSQFNNYYDQTRSCGIPTGAYYLGNAFSVEMALEEANHCLKLLEGHRFEYPIYYDVEDNMLKRNNKSDLTEIVNAFCETVEKAGYYVGVYASRDPFNYSMFDDKLKRYTHWVAFYSDKKPVLNSGASVDMWQDSSKTIIQDRRVDTDICYVDFPEAIRKLGLNGYDFLKTNEDIAKEVIEGKWGNNPERAKKLKEAGYDYKTIQNIVDAMMNKEIKVGDTICFNHIHRTSLDPVKYSPVHHSGMVTEIAKGRANPYLVNYSMGWVSDDDITEVKR